jgi:serine/threonine protein phosphatase 1
MPVAELPRFLAESDRLSSKSRHLQITEIAKFMIARRLFFRDSTPSGPKKHRAYAVGDVHGRIDLLDRLLAAINAEIAGGPRAKVSLVFLGDVIDRGPASAEVVERLRTLAIPGVTAHFVMGNHEEVMLRVIDGETDLLKSWLQFGGTETLHSYGVEPRELRKLSSEDLEASMRESIPSAHRRFLASFSDSIAFGDYVMVHAGIRPGIDLSEQSQSDLRWIREPFLEDTTDHGFVVVHGHTITNAVEATPNRIGIDTGAYSTGTLTALAIDGRKRWLIQTSDDGERRVPLD